MRAITGWRSEQGSTIVMVAVSLAALLAVGALAVDMGMLLKVRNDAQRTADAAALAGAAAYLKQKPADAVDSAFIQAFEYAGKNYVGGTWVDTSNKSEPFLTTNGTHHVMTSNEAVVVVIPDTEKVRVIVRRTTTGTFFARLFNIQTVPVAAKAAAVASNASSSNLCIKPFALPDIWSESPTEDPNQNHLQDVGTNWNQPDEDWSYGNNPGDYYRAFGDDSIRPGVPATPTGWGSSYRNDFLPTGGSTYYWDDYGRQIRLKVTSPTETPSPSFFQPWVIPGSGPGAADYKQNIWSCSHAEINLTQDYNDYSTDPELSKPGNMVGPTFQGMDSLIAQDPDACWYEFPDDNHLDRNYMTGEVRRMVGGSCTGEYAGWRNSPRVITVPLFDPAQIQPGRTSLRFNNLGVFFIEAQNQMKDPVTARFLFFAQGTGTPGSGGPLIKKLRLVE